MPNTAEGGKETDREPSAPPIIMPKIRQRQQGGKREARSAQVSQGARIAHALPGHGTLPAHDTLPALATLPQRGVSSYHASTLVSRMPLPRRRVTSEFRPPPGRNFRIGPVDRIASRPVYSPLAQERALVRGRNETCAGDEKVPAGKTGDGKTRVPKTGEPKTVHAKESPGEKLPGTRPPAAPQPATPLVKLTTYDPTHQTPQNWTCEPEPIGKGSFSVVYVTEDHQVAIKVTRIDQAEDDDTRVRIQGALMRELRLLQGLHHSNIVEFLGYDSNLENDEVKMALRFYAGGDLFGFILHHRTRVSAPQLRVIFSNICGAVRYLHHRWICHRDIKLENVLLRYQAQEILTRCPDQLSAVAVLSDFGLAKQIDRGSPMMTTRCGSEDYVSPELLLGLEYDGRQNDCWSLGVLLYAMLEGRLPFDPPPNRPHRLGRCVRPSHRISTITWSWYQMREPAEQAGGDKMLGNHPATPQELAPAMEIVDHLLVKRTRRWDIDQVCAHPWVAECAGYTDNREQ